MFVTLMSRLRADTIPMQHDGMYALMSWRDLNLARATKGGLPEGLLLLFVLALWLPLLLLA